MPVIYQKFIYRADLQANPEVLYLFGDNLVRRGLGGQAKEMRGEPNACGVATKRTPSNNPGEFFSDDDFVDVMMTMASDLKPARLHLANGGIVVIPLDGLGTGLSELPTRAPKINAALETLLANLDP